MYDSPHLGQVTGPIDRAEPLFWWTGMADPRLQLMLHGDNLAASSVEIDHEGVHVKAVTSLGNPNYLFVDLHIDPETHPGTFPVRLVKDGQVLASFDYTLMERDDGSAQRIGFNSSDVMYLLMPDRFANGNPDNDVIRGCGRTTPTGPTSPDGTGATWRALPNISTTSATWGSRPSG
ncbi:MAG: cyclomaltodextrinase N-terminal domain-containing protein [Bacteroidales bacterium]